MDAEKVSTLPEAHDSKRSRRIRFLSPLPRQNQASPESRQAATVATSDHAASLEQKQKTKGIEQRSTPFLVS